MSEKFLIGDYNYVLVIYRNESMSPLQLSIYTHSSKRSTFGLSTTLFPRHSNYTPSKVTRSLSEANGLSMMLDKSL